MGGVWGGEAGDLESTGRTLPRKRQDTVVQGRPSSQTARHTLEEAGVPEPVAVALANHAGQHKRGAAHHADRVGVVVAEVEVAAACTHTLKNAATIRRRWAVASLRGERCPRGPLPTQTHKGLQRLPSWQAAPHLNHRRMFGYCCTSSMKACGLLLWFSQAHLRQHTGNGIARGRRGSSRRKQHQAAASPAVFDSSATKAHISARAPPPRPRTCS